MNCGFITYVIVNIALLTTSPQMTHLKLKSIEKWPTGKI